MAIADQINSTDTSSSNGTNYMGFIDDELAQVSKFCKNVLPNCKLVSCVRSMVRVEIT